MFVVSFACLSVQISHLSICVGLAEGQSKMNSPLTSNPSFKKLVAQHKASKAKALTQVSFC